MLKKFNGFLDAVNLTAHSFPHPGSLIAHRVGDPLIIECAVIDASVGRQLRTYWSLKRTGTGDIPVEARSFLRHYTEIRYEGTRRPEDLGSLLVSSTFDDRIVINPFPEILDNYTLTCAAGNSIRNQSVADFPMRAYGI